MAESPVFATRELRELGVVLYDCEHKTPVDEGIGYPYVAIPNIREGHLDLTSVRRISRANLGVWNRRVTPRAGDVIMTRRGRVGDVAVVPPGLECAIGQNLVILRCEGPDLDQDFLRWVLRGPAFEAEVARLLNVGAVFDSLNCSDIPKIRVNVPPLSEQRRIAATLAALDDKIESNRRTVRLGVDLARLVLNGGFRRVRLRDVADVHKGLSYKGDGLAEVGRGLPMVNLANFKADGWLDPRGLKFYDGEYKARHEVVTGDLLVANTDLTQQRVILGRPALVPPSVGRGLFTHHVFAVRTTSDAVRLGLWSQLNGPEFRERAEGFATGTTVAGMPVDALLDFEFDLPADAAVSEGGDLIRRTWHAEAEDTTLRALRDALLPELLSGRVRVSDAGANMESLV